MSIDFAHRTVAEIVSVTPSISTLFEKYQIDYCCHGGRSLAAACAAQHVDLAEVVQALEAASNVSQPVPRPEEDWAHLPLAQLIQNIVSTHHAFLRAELPRVSGMLAKVVRAHGSHHPELVEVERLFAALGQEIGAHMVKEEQILFPAIVKLAVHRSAGPRRSWLQGPIHVMEHEHQVVGDLLGEMRRRTAGYTLPPDACNTYRMLFHSLERLEADTHLHIHKENNVLFPRASRLEQGLLDPD